MFILNSSCCYQTKAGSWSWSTMMNPIATRMRARLTSTMRQHTPLVLGQNGFGADMVSTTTPALVVLRPVVVLPGTP